MTTKEMNQFKHRQPFHPFDICLADGRKIRVKHPDFLGYAGGRTALVGDEDGDFQIIDLPLVTSLDTAEEASQAQVK